ncbi:MAG: hypothetical protein K6F61_04145 [Clostridiales bacterium]|nr:hypothetical protein [Clostridiales bacterium]
MLHTIPDAEKVDYARSLADSIKSIVSLDDFVNADEHEVDMSICALEIAYELVKSASNIRVSRAAW